MAKLGEMFSPKIPKMPELPAPVRMPDREDPAMQEAGRRRRMMEEARSGRESTNLSPSYNNSDLGL